VGERLGGKVFLPLATEIKIVEGPHGQLINKISFGENKHEKLEFVKKQQ
jgi:hypothetical protein